MTARRFLTDAELDGIISTLPSPDAIPVATLDQFGAADREMAGIGRTAAANAVANGGWAFLGAASEDLDLRKRMIRPRLKIMLAAFSAGVTHLCEHTRQIRPLLLSCDPPSLVCLQPACMARVDQNAKTVGFRWDNYCDGCGRYAETVFPYLTALGPLGINAHLCQSCADEMKATAIEAADEMHAIGRKSPCPCGSGRRFKRCHGRAA